MVVLLLCLLSLVSCSLSEVRSGRFEGRGLGVLSRLETGRRGNGRSGQRVGYRHRLTDSECGLRRHCLSTAVSGWATARYLGVQSYRIVVDARSNRWTMINRERPARFSWRRLVLPRGWSTASRTEGNWREKESSFLSFLAFPCLALPGLPALSWLGFDLERAGAGGRDAGCTVLSTGTMQCNLLMDGLYVGRKKRLSHVSEGGW